jgi:predicted Zn-dependent protease with MMP-like domain
MLWKAAHVEAVGAWGKLAAWLFPPLWRQAMRRRFDHPPSAEEIEAIARDAMRRLPEPFASHLAHVVLQVDEYADDALLAEMGIEHPLDLTGVYEGIPIGQRSVDMSGTLPDRIRLFRQAILAEWAEEGEPLEHLVRHILIHEVGHHFGLSDEDMHVIEEQG